MILEYFKIFFAILAEEIGDKSQLATLGFASHHGKWIAFTASAAALIIASFIASFAGDYLQTKINVRYLSIGSGILFIIIGIWTISSALRVNH
ncbi:MAG TPA: TMEM165/GDT1 family protein [Candidatus Paceibacterota bacterium]|jgi:putative Ca2+/H+ antiporter (TMEM165/GDT1 family)|nr:TMEM165/GDT1 family protein [Candidatus Paceibacterota bacterium]